MNLEELDNLRKKIKNTYIISFIIFLCVSAAIIIFLKIEMYYTIFFLVIYFIIAFLITIGKRKRYNLAFKDYFVLRSLKNIFTDLKYNPERGISESVIADTQMMDMGDRYHSNDYVEGKYKGISFMQSDVHIEEERQTTDSDGHTRTEYVTIFRGRWMVFDFNKSFKANIQVKQKGFSNSKLVNSLFHKEQRYKKVKMESEEFNKRFKVYAQSEHDAFYILTPSLMEKIEKLDDNNKGKLLLCFIDNKLHVGLADNKDSFEHGSVFFKINEEKEMNKISSDIKTITMFVDELNLDNDLFRKEV